MKCSMRCDEQTPSKLAVRRPRLKRVHLGHPQALRAVAGRRSGHRVGGVVDAHHLAARRQEAGRLEPLAAPDVQHPAAADAIEDGPVAGLVQGEQGVRRDALLGPLPRQLALVLVARPTPSA